MRRLSALLFATAFALPVQADEITDSLQAAIDAYQSGDVQYAIEELDFARQQLLALKTDSLGAFLPEAPAGWTREVDTEMNAGLAMMGGGVGAEASYETDTGSYAKIVLMADNPMVASLGAMVANAAMMGMKVERIGRQRFATQDGQWTALVGNRVLVQAEGDEAAIRALLETMDFNALGGFGS